MLYVLGQLGKSAVSNGAVSSTCVDWSQKKEGNLKFADTSGWNFAEKNRNGS